MHKEDITSLYYVPDSRTDIISVSHDGQLFIWDAMNGSIKKDLILDKSFQAILHFDKKFEILYFIHKSKKNVCLGMHSFVDKSMTDAVIADWSTHSNKSAMGGEDENRFAAVICKPGLIVWSAVSGKQTLFKYDKVVCVAAHPTDSVLAVSYMNRKIEVWWNAFASCRINLKMIVLLWHVSPSYCITFSSSGCYLLSGSNEGVLVRWDLSQGSHVDNKQYMARLGAPLQEITCSDDDANYVISLASNSFLMVNSSTLQIEHRHEGLLTNPYASIISLKDVFPSGLSVDPNSKYLVTNSLPGLLQFYDPLTMMNAFSLNVTDQNFVSPVGNKKPLYSDVYSVCISDSGKWLVTYSHMNSSYEGVDNEAQLVFWIHDKKKKRFQRLHNFELALSASISSMMFRSKLHTGDDLDVHRESELVIGQDDGCVMLWRRMKHPDTLSIDKTSNISKYGVYWNLSRHWFLGNIPLKSKRTESCPLLMEFSPVHDNLSAKSQSLLLARGDLIFSVSWYDLDKGLLLPAYQSTVPPGYRINHLKFSKKLPSVNFNQNSRTISAFRFITSEVNAASGSSSMTIWELKHSKISHDKVWSIQPITVSPLRVSAIAIHPTDDLTAVCHVPCDDDTDGLEDKAAAGEPHIFIFHATENHPIFPINSFAIPVPLTSLIWFGEHRLLGLHASALPQCYLFETEYLTTERQNELKSKKEKKLNLDGSTKTPLALQLAESVDKSAVSKSLIPGLDVETKLTDYRRDLDEKWDQLSRYPAYTAPPSKVLFKELLTFDLKSYLNPNVAISDNQEFFNPASQSLSLSTRNTEEVQSENVTYESRDSDFSFYIADFENLALSASSIDIIKSSDYKTKNNTNKATNLFSIDSAMLNECPENNDKNGVDLLVPDSQEASLGFDYPGTFVIPCSQDQSSMMEVE